LIEGLQRRHCCAGYGGSHALLMVVFYRLAIEDQRDELRVPNLCRSQLAAPQPSGVVEGARQLLAPSAGLSLRGRD
jgi:hypothetical protein